MQGLSRLRALALALLTESGAEVPEKKDDQADGQADAADLDADAGPVGEVSVLFLDRPLALAFLFLDLLVEVAIANGFFVRGGFGNFGQGRVLKFLKSGQGAMTFARLAANRCRGSIKILRLDQLQHLSGGQLANHLLVVRILKA